MSAKKSVIRLMTAKDGDKVILDWDPGDKSQVKQVRKSLTNLVRKGCLVFEVATHEEEIPAVTVRSQFKGIQMHEADINELEVTEKPQEFVASPAMAGG